MPSRSRTWLDRLMGRLTGFLALTTVACALGALPAEAAPSPNGKKTAAVSKKSAAAAKKGNKQAKATSRATKNAKVTKATKAVAGKKKTVSRASVKASSAKTVVARGKKRAVSNRAVVQARPSFGQLAGLHKVGDPLDLKSSVALVMDQDTQEVLFKKNEHAVLPIASITKLMTGLIIQEARLPMNALITITKADVDTEKYSSSRLRVGTRLTRRELLHLALMSSENRAAHALGRTYPGGLKVFVAEMNARAKLLGMNETRFVEPTGLSSRNQSSARDLATLVAQAHADPVLRELSTSTGMDIAVGKRTLHFSNTNRLVADDDWDIGLQKTGYISEAGRCLVMQAEVSGRRLIMVFLDSAGKYSRLADAERVRKWVQTLPETARQRHQVLARAAAGQ